ncbi:hypothetical protein HDG33_006070 [Paraburkholderia sp. Cpub6]|nr:hypothetical protein [Paraburkholderia sp. Cpub6]MBB5462396.1 hypothetical protein [Paraburkholderia sp. Cpub6]
MAAAIQTTLDWQDGMRGHEITADVRRGRVAGVVHHIRAAEDAGVGIVVDEGGGLVAGGFGQSRIAVRGRRVEHGDAELRECRVGIFDRLRTSRVGG